MWCKLVIYSPFLIIESIFVFNGFRRLARPALPRNLTYALHYRVVLVMHNAVCGKFVVLSFFLYAGLISQYIVDIYLTLQTLVPLQGHIEYLHTWAGEQNQRRFLWM